MAGPTAKHRKREIVAAIKRHGYEGKRICKALRITRGTLCHRLRHWGLVLQPTLHLHSDEELHAAIDLCSSLQELADYLHVTLSRLKRNLHLRNMKTGYAKNKRQMRNITTPVLFRIYKETGYSVKRTAAQLGFCMTAVQRNLKRRGIETSNGRSIFPWDQYELYTLHVVQEFSTWGIAELYGATERTVRNAFKRFGIPFVNNRNNGRVPTERPVLPMTDEAWDAQPENCNGHESERRLVLRGLEEDERPQHPAS